MKWKQQGNHMKKACKKDNRMILWFEVDDTGCGRNLKTFCNDIENSASTCKIRIKLTVSSYL